MVVVKHRNSFLEAREVDGTPGERYVCILLNSEALQAEVKALISIWKVFDFTVCADGGANRLHDGLKSLAATDGGDVVVGGRSERAEREEDLLRAFCPTHIKGDLDSLRPDVEAYYRNAKSCVVRDSDQDTNDLQKCLRLAQELVQPSLRVPLLAGSVAGEVAGDAKEANSENGSDGLRPVVVVVFGAFGGRFDQQMASLHALYEYSSVFHRMVLLGDGNCATLLAPDASHSITLVEGIEGPCCSLLPVGNRCERVSTSGLKWNLADQPLALGELISSSNRVRSDGNEITVKTSEPLLWCCSSKFGNVGPADC